ncbi:hypothetical protein GEMRC1_004886 [Eukaryota sp. GEM-RC1]
MIFGCCTELLEEELTILCYDLTESDKTLLYKGHPTVFAKLIKHMLLNFSSLVSRYLYNTGYTINSSQTDRYLVETSLLLLVTEFSYRELISIDQVFTYPSSQSLTFEKLLLVYILAKAFKRKHNELVLDAFAKDPRSNRAEVEQKLSAWRHIKPLAEYEREFRELYRQNLPSPNVSHRKVTSDSVSNNDCLLLPEYCVENQQSPLDFALWVQALSPKKAVL